MFVKTKLNDLRAIDIAEKREAADKSVRARISCILFVLTKIRYYFVAFLCICVYLDNPC